MHACAKYEIRNFNIEAKICTWQKGSAPAADDFMKKPDAQPVQRDVEQLAQLVPQIEEQAARNRQCRIAKSSELCLHLQTPFCRM